jgi:FkbH-like protein
MKYFIFRNHTAESLFKGIDASFSHYEDINVLDAERFEAFIWFYLVLPKTDTNLQVADIESYFNKLNLVVQTYPRQAVIVFLLSSNLLPVWSITDRRLVEAVNQFNEKVIALSRSNPSVKFVDFSHFTHQYSRKDLLDWRYYYISDMVINPKLAKDFRNWWLQQERVLGQKRKKCLILDLDNTLWGGILGEDGLTGIKIGDTYPGRAFRHFQELILEAGKNGVILAVCSKNNELDVEEAWANHPSMVLKKEHLAAYRINWQNKVQNITEIADELNIGLDSLVFLDDNPAERAIVRQSLPEVSVPEFPIQAYDLPVFFEQVYDTYFSAYQLTAEDRTKTEQYLENTQRKIYQQTFLNMDDYLSSLDMQLAVHNANPLLTVRMAQMTQKTNQFNLTTRRYLETDIENWINKGAIVCCLGVKDKFGDNGITVATIIEIGDKKAHFDSYLLSCRILGRGIEKAFIHFLLNQLIEQGVEEVTAEYIPTTKNRQTESFFESIGFIQTGINESGHKHYKLALTEKFELKPYYKFDLTQWRTNTPSV